MTNQKNYEARIPFSTAGQHYGKGDPVPPGPVLAEALRYGNKFVVETLPTSAPSTEDLDKKTKADLYTMAIDLGFEVNDSMTKADLIGLITNGQAS